MKRICLLGCGRLGSVIARALQQGAVHNCELTAVYVRSPEKAESLSARLSCPVVCSVDMLMKYKPDYVIEAASPETVHTFAPQILCGADMIVISTSALGDERFRHDMEALTEKTDRHIYLAHGVIGGLDVVEAAAMMGLSSASLLKRKFPLGSAHSDAELDRLADHFSGTAEDALRLYPNLLNVGVSLGLASGNLSAVRVDVENADCVDFTVDCSGAFGDGHFYTKLSTPGPELAAWSALVTLKHATSRITF